MTGLPWRPLIDTFDRRTEDHSGRAGATLPGWLEAATGVELGWDRTDARALWREAREGADIAGRLPSLRALERARLAADDRDAGAMLEELEQAVADAVASDSIVQARAARMAGAWAHIHADPEASVHDPKLARALAEAVLRWDPRDVRAFVDFAWATLSLGDLEFCRSALEKVALADPRSPRARGPAGPPRRRRSRGRTDGPLTPGSRAIFASL